MYNILSIDGGGVRGYIPARVLYKLESYMKTEVDENFKICEYFDMFTGVSTGSLIACGFASCRESAKWVSKQYSLKNFHKIMHKSTWDNIVGNLQFKPKYDDTEKHKLTCRVFGEGTFAQCHKHTLVPVYDIQNREAKIFDSFECNNTLKVCDVCDASTAAPGFFPSKHIVHAHDDGQQEYSSYFIDGGVVRNNPSLLAIIKAKQNLDLNGESRKIRLLSLGCGYQRTAIEGKESLAFGGIDWLSHGILDILMDDSITDQEVAIMISNQKDYLRINGPLTNVSYDLDTTTADNYVNMKKLADMWWSDNKERLLEFFQTT